MKSFPVPVAELREARARPAVGDAKQVSLAALSHAVLVTVHLKNALQTSRTKSDSSVGTHSAFALIDEELQSSAVRSPGNDAVTESDLDM